jgi:N-acetylglucosaminyl-diphospho-decaprenol L-rhamnosyltransferase
MNLSIIIVNYKSAEKTINCIKSIEKNIAGLSYEIILVDNNSGDGGLEKIKSNNFKNIKYIESYVNLGMGGGNNLGVNSACAKYLLILNPDTVIKNGAIKELYTYLEQSKEDVIVGPKLIYPSGELQFSALRFPNFWMPILRRTFVGNFFRKSIDKFLMKDFNHADIREVDWLMGSALMFKREVFDRIGGFDKRYFMYFEDTDLCKSAWSLGIKVVYNPKALFVHDHERGSAYQPWYRAIFVNHLSREHIKSWLKYFLKWRNK